MQREVVFDGHKVSVEFDDNRVNEVMDFMFQDLPETSDSDAEVTLEVRKDQESGDWVLSLDDKSLFSGADINGMANILMGEVLFHLIAGNVQRLAIHAGLVSGEKGSILLPANSGSGKSSVTTWLTSRGLHYHTDELVLIDLESHALKAFTRPLNIKAKGVDPIAEIVPLESFGDEIRVSSMVTMIPHRLVNADFHTDIPPLCALVFPQYIADSKPEASLLSRAEAGLEMMRSNVIARNLPNHGFNQVISLVRDIPAYRLHYSHFDDLAELFRDII